MEITDVNKIHHILERDSKDTTYKFALLRATIEICTEQDHHLLINGNEVHFPLGLVVDKWLLYYYPIVENRIAIAQRMSGGQLSFRKYLEPIVKIYSKNGGFPKFFSDYSQNKIDPQVSDIFYDLIKQIRSTIRNMPMKYLGNSINKMEYSIFHKDNSRISYVDFIPSRKYVIHNLGYFSFDRNLYIILKDLGNFILGKGSILYQWAEFTSKIDANRNMGITPERMLTILNISPLVERDTNLAREIYLSISKNSNLICIWSGKTIDGPSDLHIDHLVPFSVWRNNDLWNMLPTKAFINEKKKDKIPSLKMLEKSKKRILNYWKYAQQQVRIRFEDEISINLFQIHDTGDWMELAFNCLINKCAYLISSLGHEEWDY